MYFLVIFWHFFSVSCQEKNVCPTYIDYITIKINGNCWYNPDIGSPPGPIVNRHGYLFEEYQVTTQDGYNLSLFRIPTENTDKPPIFLQHGIMASGVQWVMIGRNSLAFRFAEQGFDVWMGNFRGSIYSNIVKPDKFWDFSFHEMGFYDIPAMLEFVKNNTGKKIVYIGHSMGSTTSYVYSILRKTHAEEHLLMLISLAPVAYMRYFNSLVKITSPLLNPLKFILNLIKIYGYGMTNNKAQTEFFFGCLYSPATKICEFVSVLLLSLISESIPPETIPILLTHVPSGTALKTLEHYAQEISAEGQFQFFDYGSLNRQIYNGKEPPVYNVSEISIPTHLIYGTRDTIADEKDVKHLFAELRTRKSIKSLDFDHFDFVLGKNINELYPVLAKIIGEEVKNVAI